MAHNKTLTKSLLALFGMSVVGGGLALSLGFTSDRTKADASTQKKPLLVSVTTTRTLDLPIELVAQGHLVSLNQVELRPQATAMIQSVNFKEGDDVREGQLLFTLDATDANAQLRRFEAQAAQINAQLTDAMRDLGRASEMLKSNFIAPSAVDTAASKVDALKAQLKAADAETESARVLVAHTRIKAPISGKAGAISVHVGSLAQLGSALPLVTLAQFDPISVEFSLPEKYLNQMVSTRAKQAIAVSLEGPSGKTIDGSLSFINNSANTDTGTINLKAVFPNKSKDLWPGTFARVTLHAGVTHGAVVLAPQAILEGPGGRFVYVVGDDGAVSAKPVSLSRIQNETAVVEGLSSGVRVVLEGGNNLRPGMVVQVAETKVQNGAADLPGAAATRGETAK